MEGTSFELMAKLCTGVRKVAGKKGRKDYSGGGK